MPLPISTHIPGLCSTCSPPGTLSAHSLADLQELTEGTWEARGSTHRGECTAGRPVQQLAGGHVQREGDSRASDGGVALVTTLVPVPRTRCFQHQAVPPPPLGWVATPPTLYSVGGVTSVESLIQASTAPFYPPTLPLPQRLISLAPGNLPVPPPSRDLETSFSKDPFSGDYPPCTLARQEKTQEQLS